MLLTSDAQSLEVINQLLMTDLPEKSLCDLQRHLQAKTIKQLVHKVHKVQHVQIFWGTVERPRVTLPQNGVERLKVITGQLPECVTNSLITEEAHKTRPLFSTEFISKLVKRLK